MQHQRRTVADNSQTRLLDRADRVADIDDDLVFGRGRILQIAGRGILEGLFVLGFLFGNAEDDGRGIDRHTVEDGPDDLGAGDLILSGDRDPHVDLDRAVDSSQENQTDTERNDHFEQGESLPLRHCSEMVVRSLHGQRDSRPSTVDSLLLAASTQISGSRM